MKELEGKPTYANVMATMSSRSGCGHAIRGSHLRRRFIVSTLAPLFLLVYAPSALAGNAYVADFNSSAVSVINTQTDQPAANPIAVGAGPYAVAITPDAKSAYVTSEVTNDVSVINTQTNQTVGSAIKVGEAPRGIAITPDGRTAYVANYGSKSVSVINTQTNQVVGSPITVGPQPIGIAITPDGRTAYVTNYGSKSVSVIDTQTNQVVGGPITVGEGTFAIAITPDGTTAYVSNNGSGTVSVINTQTNQTVGSAIKVGEAPHGIAITPDGTTAYTANYASNSVSVIDTQTNQVAGSAIKVGEGPVAVAITPHGRTAYVANYASKSLSVIDTQTNQVTGGPITVGDDPASVAVTPDQSPLASFSATAAPAGAATSFDASASRDSDGRIASYTWSFGDGQTGSGGPSTTHAYAAPGTYTVSLTLTDDEGCSTALLFTGQTALCNGTAEATATRIVSVPALTVPAAPATKQPRVRVRCPRSAKPGGCTFKLQVVARKPRRGKGEKARGRSSQPESALATVELKAGQARLVTLKSKPKFAAKLAAAKQVLVRETETIKGKTRTIYRRLKVVH
jgi:YVTN family beta-propeller protein